MIYKNIVLLHGWGASIQKLKPLSISLINEGWKVYLPKLPGFDGPIPKISWNLDDYSQFVIQRSNTFFNNQKYFIFGHSFGGRIAIKLASIKSKQIQGIILCATSGISRTNKIKRMIFLLIAKTGKLLTLFKPVAKLFKKLIYKIAREHDYEKQEGSMKLTFRKVIKENLKPLISKINLPTLIFWGNLDKMTPLKDGKYLRSNILKSELIIIENEGHRLPYNQPELISGEIEKWYQSLK